MHCKAPKEVVDSIDSAIVSSGMLKEMLMQNEKGTVYLWIIFFYFKLYVFLEGETGYSIEIDGEECRFSTAPRAPPEGYIAEDYVSYVAISLSYIYSFVYLCAN